MKKKAIIAMLIVLIILASSIFISKRAKNIEKDLVLKFTSEVEQIAAGYVDKLKLSDDRESSIKKIKIGQTGYAFLLNDDYEFINSPNTEIIGERIDEIVPDLFTKPIDELKSGSKEVVYIYEFKGVKKGIFFAVIDDRTILGITCTLDELNGKKSLVQIYSGD